MAEAEGDSDWEGFESVGGFDSEVAMEQKFRHILEYTESRRGKKSREGFTPGCTFKLVLRCTGRDTVEEKSFSLKRFPKTVLEIKQGIESFFNIPASIQELRKGETLLRDKDTVSFHQLRNKDTLQVTYLSEGELSRIRYTVNWLRFATLLVRDRNPSILTEISSEANLMFQMAVKDDMWENLAFKLFQPWGLDIKEVNKKYFMQMRGLSAVVALYTVILEEPWRTMHLRLKFTESRCLMAIANLPSSDELRKQVMVQDVLVMCLQSFLRVKLRRGMPVIDSSGAPGRQEHNNLLLKEVMAAALDVFRVFHEAPSFHTEISNNMDVVEQLLCVGHSPSFSPEQAMVALCILCSCATSSDSRKLICRANTIDGMLDVAKVRKAMGAQPLEVSMLKYLGQVFTAQMLLGCHENVPRRLYDKIQEHMEDFLRTADFVEIADFTRRLRLDWFVVYAFLELVYCTPKSHCLPPRLLIDTSVNQLKRLKELALGMQAFVIQVIHSLNYGMHNML